MKISTSWRWTNDTSPFSKLGSRVNTDTDCFSIIAHIIICYDQPRSGNATHRNITSKTNYLVKNIFRHQVSYFFTTRWKESYLKAVSWEIITSCFYARVTRVAKSQVLPVVVFQKGVLAMTTVKLTLGKCHLKINICAVVAILRLSHASSTMLAKDATTEVFLRAPQNIYIGELKMYGCGQMW